MQSPPFPRYLVPPWNHTCLKRFTNINPKFLYFTLKLLLMLLTMHELHFFFIERNSYTDDLLNWLRYQRILTFHYTISLSDVETISKNRDVLKSQKVKRLWCQFLLCLQIYLPTRCDCLQRSERDRNFWTSEWHIINPLQLPLGIWMVSLSLVDKLSKQIAWNPNFAFPVDLTRTKRPTACSVSHLYHTTKQTIWVTLNYTFATCPLFLPVNSWRNGYHSAWGQISRTGQRKRKFAHTHHARRNARAVITLTAP